MLGSVTNKHSVLILKKVSFQTIQFGISKEFQCLKRVPFQIIQFSISTQLSSIWPRDRAISGATTPGQSGPGSDGNETVLRIPNMSSITVTSPSDCLVSYSGHSLARVLPLCRGAIGVFYSPSRLGWDWLVSYSEDSFWGVWSFCREAVGFFYSPSWLIERLSCPF